MVYGTQQVAGERQAGRTAGICRNGAGRKRTAEPGRQWFQNLPGAGESKRQAGGGRPRQAGRNGGRQAETAAVTHASVLQKTHLKRWQVQQVAAGNGRQKRSSRTQKLQNGSIQAGRQATIIHQAGSGGEGKRTQTQTQQRQVRGRQAVQAGR